MQSGRLEFNLTPKEFDRAKSHENWVVVVVTSVLSPHNFNVHLITRNEILAANRVVTGYRLSL